MSGMMEAIVALCKVCGWSVIDGGCGCNEKVEIITPAPAVIPTTGTDYTVGDTTIISPQKGTKCR